MPKESLKKHKLTAVPDVRVEPEQGNSDGRDSETSVCPLCFGSGLEVIPGKGARPCSCRKKNEKVNGLQIARIPARYSQCDFKNYNPQNASQRRAVWMCDTLSSEFHPGYEGEGILLMGGCGVGKTHLAVSILKELLNKGISCLFYEFGALLKEIQDSYTPKTQSSELGVLSPVLNSEVLVLDELGGSKPTDWVRDTMAHIINTRYNDRKLTIFTTNYTDERRSEREETLEDRIGARLRSRIYEMCKTVNIIGQDYRRNFCKPVESRKK